jgi:hypothetical protein
MIPFMLRRRLHDAEVTNIKLLTNVRVTLDLVRQL